MQILCHNYVAEIPSKRAIFTLFACADLQSVHPIGLCSFDAVSGVISYFSVQTGMCNPVCLWYHFFDGTFILAHLSLLRSTFFRMEERFKGRLVFGGNTDYTDGTDDHGFFKIFYLRKSIQSALSACFHSIRNTLPQYCPTADPTAATNAIAEKTHTPTVKELFWFSTMSDFFFLLLQRLSCGFSYKYFAGYDAFIACKEGFFVFAGLARPVKILCLRLFTIPFSIISLFKNFGSKYMGFFIKKSKNFRHKGIVVFETKRYCL